MSGLRDGKRFGESKGVGGLGVTRLLGVTSMGVAVVGLAAEAIAAEGGAILFAALPFAVVAGVASGRRIDGSVRRPRIEGGDGVECDKGGDDASRHRQRWWLRPPRETRRNGA